MRLYTKDQWRWAWERYREGYTYRELGRFLQAHPETVHRQFVRMGLLPALREDLPPLEERRGEFDILEELICP